ncbi:MAG: hypothetical protein Q9181_000720 [Wetmoreana brouardii]
MALHFSRSKKQKKHKDDKQRVAVNCGMNTLLNNYMDYSRDNQDDAAGVNIGVGHKLANDSVSRSPQGVSGHWPPSPNGNQPDPQTLPHADLRAKHCRRKVEILVFLDEAEEGQEGKWRDHKPQRGTMNLRSTISIHEKRPQRVKIFGIWIRYDSRSGTHNMYKEYREMSRTDAVEALYQDMAARHRARFRSIHILKVVEIEKTDDVKRPYIKQLLTKNLKFPLPHRVPKATSSKLFAAHRPSTFA